MKSVNGDHAVYKDFDAYFIAENCLPKMKGDNTTYLYVDTEDAGYFNYYNLRYCMAPKAISVDRINNYIYVINHGSAQDFMNYVKSKNPDYIIVRENKLLEESGYRINKKTGTVFSFDENATSIEHFLREAI